MLIVGDRRFIVTPFDNEEELERVVLDNYEDIFGPDSILLPKKLIKSADGSGTIPDAFVVDLLQRRWYVVEAELLGHGVWRHIAPQIAKQLVAATQTSTRKLLLEAVVDLYKTDANVRILFEESDIAEVDVRSVIAGIFETPPIVALPIDSISEDLRLWAGQQKADMRLWTVRKLVDSQDYSTVVYEIPDEFAPSLAISHTEDGGPSITAYGVSVSGLIEAGLLHAGQSLHMRYKPQGGEQTDFVATLEADGSILLLGERFSSLSLAAIHGMKSAGSQRKTKNGWRAWSTEDGRKLWDIRADFLKSGGAATKDADE